MTKFNDKITHLLNSQVPDFVLEDHPKFVEFLKAYFTFMESAELSFTSVQTTDGILLETETSQENLLLLKTYTWTHILEARQIGHRCYRCSSLTTKCYAIKVPWN